MVERAQEEESTGRDLHAVPSSLTAGDLREVFLLPIFFCKVRPVTRGPSMGCSEDKVKDLQKTVKAIWPKELW